VYALTLQDARLKRSFHGDDLTIRKLDIPNWLENVQPKQERHSMQIPGKVQRLLAGGLRAVGFGQIRSKSERRVDRIINSIGLFRILLRIIYYCY